MDKITLNYIPKISCNLNKEIHGDQCCCICKFRKAVTGHPWYNDSSILTETGIYVCVNPEFENVILTGEHSIGCECFERKNK